MKTVKDRLKEWIEQLPDDAALELERSLAAAADRADEEEWRELALGVFEAWFDEGEVEYTQADARPNAS